ncbi:hypothetical protein HDU89_003586 [Geranomyces variabilis]|nr:hypothetical protein HDU89_003586 [Geranomyces variabilis]
MLTKSLSFAVVGLAASVVAQQPGLPAGFPQLPAGLPTPAGFPANVPASIPTVLPPIPAGVPNALPPMPAGIPTVLPPIPAGVPSVLPAPPSNLPAFPSAVVGAPTAASGAPTPIVTAPTSGQAPMCGPLAATFSMTLTACANQGVAASYLKPALSRTDADAAFQNIGKCVCTNIAAMDSKVQEYVTSCPTKESADVGKYRDACKSNDLMRVAAQMQITLKDGTTGTIYNPSQSAGSTLASKNTVALAGLAAFGFALLV